MRLQCSRWQHEGVELSERLKESRHATREGQRVVIVMPIYLCQNVYSATGVPGGYNAAEEKMMSVRCIEKLSDSLSKGSLEYLFV